MENKRGFIMRNGICIGQDVQRVFSTCPLGTVLSYAGQIAPYGYLLCDGASYLVKDYPDLYAVIGNTYGGDDANFNVPDYRETVLVGVGENTTDTIASHDVYEIGEFKDDQFQGHWHNLGSSDGTVTVSLGAGEKGGSANSAASDASMKRYVVNTALDAITDGTNGEPRTGTTTHGKQKGVTYIIKAFHTNEGTDSGVSDDVVEYVAGEVAEVETALPNIKKFANPSGTARYITISGATLGDIEVHSAYAGKYMFTSTGAKPIFFGTSTYLGYTLTGWAWNSDKTKLYLRVSGHRDFVISAFGSDGVEISDMTTTAPTDVTFNATFNYNAYIDNSTSENTSTYSSAKIDEKIATYILSTRDGQQKWLVLDLGNADQFHPITVSDHYGGKIEIIGMSIEYASHSSYKSVKVIRYSYGDWSLDSATNYTFTADGDCRYKIRGVYYNPNDNKYYVEIMPHVGIRVSGTVVTAPTMVDYSSAAASEMTLIPESNWGAINDTSAGDTNSTWSSSKIAEYVAENAAPSYSGTVIPTSIANGATVTTDWNISSAGSNADYGRLLMLNSSAGTFLIHIKGNVGNTSTMPTPTVISSIGNSQSATWSSSFELSISSNKLRIKNKSGAVASWRFV